MKTTVTPDTWLGHLRAGEVLDLRDEAARAGDLAMVSVCDDALECDRAAQLECIRVIADAGAQSSAPRIVRLWLSYVGPGAPSNAAGARAGLGVDRDMAHKDAAHWNNQAPFARCKRVTLSDASEPSDEVLRMLYRDLETYELAGDAAVVTAAKAHLDARRYCSAWCVLNGIEV